MIITGGQDSLIRIWEPFVTSKPSNVLRGHNSSITHLLVDDRDDTLISIDKTQSKKEKLIKIVIQIFINQFLVDVFIWFLTSTKILQKLLVVSQIQKNQGISCVYFNKTMQKLILFNNKITAFEHANEVFLNQDRSSHAKSVLCIIYNSLFDVLISADANSVINIWDITTGELIFMEKKELLGIV
jgi:WD40 repeat protein